MSNKEDQSLKELISSESELSSGEGTENVSLGSEKESKPADDVLVKINKTIGRNYKSLEEALKGIKETYSYVGKKISETQTKKTESSGEEMTAEEKAQEALNRIQEFELLSKYPESKEILEEIKDLAESKNLSLVEAYEQSSLKSLLETKKAYDSKINAEKASMLKTSSRVGVGNEAKIKELVEEIRRTDSDRAKQDLVKEWLHLEE